MKSKLSEWANIAEIISSVAIVISLIYVGIQVNDSTRAVRSANANDITAAISDWYNNVGSSPQMAETFVRGMTDPESLPSAELAQFMYLAHSLVLEFQAAYYLSQEGTLDLQIRESITNNLAGVRELPGMQLYWAERRAVFQPSFRDFVDRVLKDATTNTEFESLYRPNQSDRQ